MKKKRLSGILLTLALILGLMPGMGLTAYAATETYTDLIPTSSDTDLTSKQVTFNSCNWYIIADNSTAMHAGTVTLMAAGTLGSSVFDGYSNQYSTSTIRTVLENMTASGGTFADVASVINTVKVKGSDNDTEVDATLYLLSTEEAENLPEKVRTISNSWWLRSPGNGTDKAMCVTLMGYIVGDGLVYSEGEVRPALQLDLSKVRFDSTANTFSLATPYPLSIRDVQVTDVNAADVLNDGGTVKYNVTSNTLTLSGVNINRESQKIGTNVGVRYSGSSPLTIVLENSNKVDFSTTGDYGCGINSTGGAIIITGTGSLLVIGNNDAISSSKAGIVINGGVITAIGGDRAVSGPVKNAIAGTGWTNTAGTEGKAGIAISTEGQKLTYKMVQFPGLPAASVTTAPAPKDLTYTGSAQELVTAGTAEGGEMQYALGTETEATEDYSTSIPTAAETGT